MRLQQILVLVPVAALFLAAACNKTPKGNTVLLGPTPIYQLRPGYKEVIPNAMAVKRYQALFNYYSQYNVPLHRVVLGDTANIYLGLIVEPIPASLSVFAQSDSVWTRIVGRTYSKGEIALLKHAKAGYNVRYIAPSTLTKQVHAVNLLTKDSSLAARYYNHDPIFYGNILF